MKKRSIASMKLELEEIIMSATPETVEKLIIVSRFIKNATPAEMATFRQQMKRKDFDVHQWIESIKEKTTSGAAPAALEMEAVQYAK